jgi:sarcosine oxidase
MAHFDIAVIGLGAMGSAVTDALARRGARVVAFDRFAPPHNNGSTHGHTRIIREAYYEHPLYVPLVRRGYELWNELERYAGETLFVRTGGLMVGPRTGPLFSGALESARAHAVDHDILDAGQIAEQFPAYEARREWVGLLERRAGFLLPERCVASMVRRAEEHGATLRPNTVVARWSAGPRGVTVETSDERVEVERLVVAAGPWLPGLRESLGVNLPLEIERQMSHWFEPVDPGPKYDPRNCPIALWEMPDGDVFATFPDDGHGVKCGMHHAGAPTSPESVVRTVSQGENAVARELLEQVMPGAGGRLKEARVCLYTNTPDHHFILDWLEGNRVLIVSPCSGHGFKFASAIGEIAGALASGEESWLDLSPFSMKRFGLKA